MFVIKIEDKYLEHITFINKKPKLKLSISTFWALKFEHKETANAIIKTIGKGELELLWLR